MLMDTEIIKIDEASNLQRNSYISCSISDVVNNIKNRTLQITVFFAIGTLTDS